MSPAAITISKSDTGVKSTTPDSPLPLTATAMRVSTSRAARFSVAVTVTSVAPLPSETHGGPTERLIVSEGSSSSSRRTDVETTSRSASPVIRTVSSFLAMVSFRGVRVNVPVPLSAFAGIVNWKSSTGANPTTFEPPPPSTITSTVVSMGRTVSTTVAVTATAVAPEFSETTAGDAVNSMLIAPWLVSSIV